MSESKFFCFGKNDFCDYAYNAGACGKCKHMDGSGGEKRSVPEPPRLDRSAWEPCEFCRERDRQVYKEQNYPGLCSFEVAQDGPDEIVVNAYNHSTPLTKDICFSFPVLFCSKCGRPLTDAAWEMLQKRLEGRK